MIASCTACKMHAVEHAGTLQNASTQLEDLVTPTQLAVLLGVSRTLVYEWIRSHGLPITRVPGRSRIHVSVIDAAAWLDARLGGDAA